MPTAVLVLGCGSLYIGWIGDGRLESGKSQIEWPTGLWIPKGLGLLKTCIANWYRCVCGGEAMANIIQDGSYVLAADTEELKGFEQELESAHLVGEWQIPRRPQPDPGGVPHIWKWDLWSP